MKNKLNLEVLPKHNCYNCIHFKCFDQEILISKSRTHYALECVNFVHPIEDCILSGFIGHGLKEWESKQ
jgi:hypothetical protein